MNKVNYIMIYADKYDITFIIKETFDENNGMQLSNELAGWYYGEPDDDKMKANVGHMKIEFRR